MWPLYQAHSSVTVLLHVFQAMWICVSSNYYSSIHFSQISRFIWKASIVNSFSMFYLNDNSKKLKLLTQAYAHTHTCAHTSMHSFANLPWSLGRWTLLCFLSDLKTSTCGLKSTHLYNSSSSYCQVGWLILCCNQVVVNTVSKMQARDHSWEGSQYDVALFMVIKQKLLFP